MSLSLAERFLRLSSVIAASIVAGGCGGDGSSGQDNALSYDPEANTTMTAAKRPPLTKDEFVRQVNEICRKAWAEVRENWDQYLAGEASQVSERKRFAEAVRFPLLSGIDFFIFDPIRELGSAEGEEHEVEAIIGPFQIAVELGWAERWSAYSMAEVVPHFATYNERAREYGLDDCLVNAEHLARVEA